MAVAALRPVITNRVNSAGAETRQHFLLAKILDADLEKHVGFVIKASDATARMVEPLLVERLSILRAAKAFVQQTEGIGTMACPSCGQQVAPAAFRDHLEAETARLENASAAYSAKDRAVSTLLDTLQNVSSHLRADQLREWLASPRQDAVRHRIQWLLALDIPGLRLDPVSIDLEQLVQHVPPILASVRKATLCPPPEAKDLLSAAKLLDAVAAHPRIRQLRARLQKIDALTAHLVELENQVRAEIRFKTESVISGISARIRHLWSLLHPGSRIDDIGLYQPEDSA